MRKSCFSLSIEVTMLMMSVTNPVRYETTSFTCLILHPQARQKSGRRDLTTYIYLQVERPRTWFSFFVFEQ